jgi:hypothetical protein
MWKRISALFVVMVIFLAACSSGLSGGTTPSPTPSENPVEAPAAFLAQQINLPLDEISLVSSEKVEWNDTCLGVSQPGEVCAQVITPGYRFILSTPAGTYQIHTNLSGKSFRIIPPGNEMVGNAALSWERSGGIAGICQKLTITYEQNFTLEDCRDNHLIDQGKLNQAQWVQLQDWLKTFTTFNWKSNPPQGSADMMNESYTFNGEGNENPSQNEEDSIAMFLGNLANQIANNSSKGLTGESTGVAGQVRIGPTCPGPQTVGSGETACADQPYQATIEVLNQRNQVVTTVETDKAGHFQVSLEPGTYTLQPRSGTDAAFPRAASQTVTVEQGRITQVQINFDTGIR